MEGGIQVEESSWSQASCGMLAKASTLSDDDDEEPGCFADLEEVQGASFQLGKQATDDDDPKPAKKKMNDRKSIAFGGIKELKDASGARKSLAFNLGKDVGDDEDEPKPKPKPNVRKSMFQGLGSLKSDEEDSPRTKKYVRKCMFQGIDKLADEDSDDEPQPKLKSLYLLEQVEVRQMFEKSLYLLEQVEVRQMFEKSLYLLEQVEVRQMFEKSLYLLEEVMEVRQMFEKSLYLLEEVMEVRQMFEFGADGSKPDVRKKSVFFGPDGQKAEVRKKSVFFGADGQSKEGKARKSVAVTSWQDGGDSFQIGRPKGAANRRASRMAPTRGGVKFAAVDQTAIIQKKAASLYEECLRLATGRLAIANKNRSKVKSAVGAEDLLWRTVSQASWPFLVTSPLQWLPLFTQKSLLHMKKVGSPKFLTKVPIRAQGKVMIPGIGVILSQAVGGDRGIFQRMGSSESREDLGAKGKGKGSMKSKDPKQEFEDAVLEARAAQAQAQAAQSEVQRLKAALAAQQKRAAQKDDKKKTLAGAGGVMNSSIQSFGSSSSFGSVSTKKPQSKLHERRQQLLRIHAEVLQRLEDLERQNKRLDLELQRREQRATMSFQPVTGGELFPPPTPRTVAGTKSPMKTPRVRTPQTTSTVPSTPRSEALPGIADSRSPRKAPSSASAAGSTTPRLTPLPSPGGSRVNSEQAAVALLPSI
eukprot:TRINITY_DN8561_c0_g2_i5.p1 TRINITY_DN8561_c0_g2~~TRINITY_DN8561_c0_g2_i5.p1  ORF type:complete len:698 (+),score=137.58 TRINITY_DN8561_c0_g2_i5:88-2181(+)